MQTVGAVTGVETVGDPLCPRRVDLHLRVQEHERRGADHLGPDSCGDVDAVDRHVHRASGVGGSEALGINCDVALVLTILIDVLAEETLAVEEADTDERHGEVACRLQVVTGEDPEPTGVLAQLGGDTELGREVGDGRLVDGLDNRSQAGVQPLDPSLVLDRPGGELVGICCV